MEKHLRKIVGSNIRYYRYLLNYTQEEVAEKCNLSTRYISDIENYNGNIPLDTIEKLAKCLKVQPYQLLLDQKLPELNKKVNIK